jgi:hypothetical protein
MALTLETDTPDTISLEEYVDYVSREVDVEDEASVLASAHKLRALANNRRFVGEYLTRQLRSWRDFQPTNRYTAPTLMLAREERFAVRANIWEPPPVSPQQREHQKALYYYQVPHDHNFSFLTVGYLGPGYDTLIYERDPDAVVGVVGERVGLRFSERTTLSMGKVMYYRASRDIHSQEHPEAFSLSINLLLGQAAPQRKDQYFFDLDAGTVSGVGSSGGTASRVMPCRLARYVGDHHTAEALEPIAANHPTPRIRVVALESLATLVSDSARAIWKRGEIDGHPLVRLRAREALAELDGLSVRPHHS